MTHSHEVRWRCGATPEGAYLARLFRDEHGRRVAILTAASDNVGPSVVNAASVALCQEVRERWDPPADRVVIAQQPSVPGGNWHDEIDDQGNPSIRIPAEQVERWQELPG